MDRITASDYTPSRDDAVELRDLYLFEHSEVTLKLGQYTISFFGPGPQEEITSEWLCDFYDATTFFFVVDLLSYWEDITTAGGKKENSMMRSMQLLRSLLVSLPRPKLSGLRHPKTAVVLLFTNSAAFAQHLETHSFEDHHLGDQAPASETGAGKHTSECFVNISRDIEGLDPKVYQGSVPAKDQKSFEEAWSILENSLAGIQITMLR